jgi:RNA polymerase sigma-70 factor (ECF subfamily)
VEADDYALLSRWRAGDRDAGGLLLKRHFRSVYLLFSNKVAGSPDDLIQETFRACVEGRDRIREMASFRAYLLATARYQLYMHYRRDRPTRELDPRRDSVAQLVSSPSRMVAHKQHHRLLLAALRQIPLEQQLILELYYWENLPASEIAQVLDVPVGTAKSRLRRARVQLTEQFAAVAESHDFRHTTADDLERWARSIQEELAMRRPGEAEPT